MIELFFVAAISVFLLAPIALLVGLLLLRARLLRAEARIVELEGALRAGPGVAPSPSPGTRPAAGGPRAAERPVPRHPAPAAAPAGVPPGRPAAGDGGPAPGPRATAGIPRARTVASTAAATPPPAAGGPGLEERLGARLPVWIAAVALTLAGVFLVKWSFDAGLLGPSMRVGLGTLFGLVLLGFGQLTRTRLGRVASATVAAGIGVLYASFLAGTSLYGLIPPALGLALVALVTFAAVALSLGHGPIIALVGMVGGFATPALIGSDDPRPGPLFFYLLLLQGGLLLTIRQRGWWSLAPLVSGAALAWVAAWLVLVSGPPETWVLGPFLLLTLVAAFTARGVGAAADGGAWSVGTPGRGEPSRAATWIAGAGSVALAMELAYETRLDPVSWGFLALIGTGCLVVGHLRREFAPLGWLAAGLGAVLLVIEGGRIARQVPVSAADELRFGLTALALGATFSAAALVLAWLAERPGPPAALAATTSVVYLLVVHLHVETPGQATWAGIGAFLALLYAALAALAGTHFDERPGRGAAQSAMIAASSFFAAFAVTVWFERASVGVWWAAEAAVLAALYLRFRLRALVTLSLLLGGAVAIRLLLNPFVLDYPIAPHPFLNWLPYGYGVPLLAAALAAWLLRRAGEPRGAACFDALSCALALALVTLMIRNAWNDRLYDAFDLTETAALTLGWLVLAGAFLLIASLAAGARPVLDPASRLVAALAALAALLGSSLVYNPLFVAADVGALPLVNRLLAIYGLPAAGLWLLGTAWRRQGDRAAPLLAGSSGLVLLFVLVTLEVRQAFHGARIHERSPGEAEVYAYSAAWLLFGLALLVGGIWRGSLALRYASLGVIALAIFKVFLYDTRELADLYRVASYLGLGISLLLLAWVYQRFVVSEPRAAPPDAHAPPPVRPSPSPVDGSAKDDS